MKQYKFTSASKRDKALTIRALEFGSTLVMDPKFKYGFVEAKTGLYFPLTLSRKNTTLHTRVLKNEVIEQLKAANAWPTTSNPVLLAGTRLKELKD